MEQSEHISASYPPPPPPSLHGLPFWLLFFGRFIQCACKHTEIVRLSAAFFVIVGIFFFFFFFFLSHRTILLNVAVSPFCCTAKNSTDIKSSVWMKWTIFFGDCLMFWKFCGSFKWTMNQKTCPKWMRGTSTKQRRCDLENKSESPALSPITERNEKKTLCCQMP